MNDILRRARLRLLKMHFDSGVGHIGGNLSALDAMLVLHHHVMTDNDRFILSKGHGAGALYVTLWSLGRLTDQQLATFHRDGTKLAGHPVPEGVPEIPLTVGSLGHGLGMAAGLALGRRLRGQAGRVYCLLSDGELNEGSTWESLSFIAHHDLRAVVPIVDVNGLQGLGSTVDVTNLGSLSRKLNEFGFDVRDENGHDAEAIERALKAPPVDRPVAVLAHTIKGHGVSFMAGKLEWHYLPMNEAQYRQAVDEVSRL